MNQFQDRGELIAGSRRVRFRVVDALPILMILGFLVSISYNGYFFDLPDTGFLVMGALFIGIVVCSSSHGTEIYDNGIQRVVWWQPKEFIKWEEVIKIVMDRKPHDSDDKNTFFIQFFTQQGQTYTLYYSSRIRLSFVYESLLERQPQLASLVDKRLNSWEW